MSRRQIVIAGLSYNAERFPAAAKIIRTADEVWGLNAGHLSPMMWDGSRFLATRWFQIHPARGCDTREHNFFTTFAEHPVKTYVHPDAVEYWKTNYPACTDYVVPFPAETIKVLRHYGFVANTFCLELALAIQEAQERVNLQMTATEIATAMRDAADIYLMGIECACYGRELAVERAGLAYWCGIAAANQIRIHYAMDTLWAYPEVYGIDYWDEARRAAQITDWLLPSKDGVTNTVNLDTLDAVETAEEKAHANS